MTEALIGIIGTFVGAYIGYKLGERSTRLSEERSALEEELDAKLYAQIVRDTKHGEVVVPDPESGEFRRILRLQQRGLIERLPVSGLHYRLPGAPIALDLSKKEKPSPTQE
jgi:hypothetical protein